jgi:DNA mismatch repair protein MutL
MTIRQLPPLLVNRIAAGEVIERPAAAIKELVENAIDAGARHIEVLIEEGGASRFVVTDDGFGMSGAELLLAVERHCTSKLEGDDLSRIASLGFRGEALPSIGAVSRMRIFSRAKGAEEAWEIAVEAGRKSAPVPAAHAQGTRVEVRDLFFATPARLKFLKSPKSERDAALDAVKRLALAHPEIAFTVAGEGGRTVLRLPAAASRRARLAQLLGRDFAESSLPIEASRGAFRLSGEAGLPSLNRAAPREQYLVVNGRPVRDKLLLGAVRAAYQDVTPHGRHPMVVLFVEGPFEEIDVNVHPTKAEIRFRDSGLVRGLIVGALKAALASAVERPSSALSPAVISAFRPHASSFFSAEPRPRISSGAGLFAPAPNAPSLAFAESASGFGRAQAQVTPSEAIEPLPLGRARAQLHGTYILAETETGIVLVDQHAAHERLLYERMKKALAEGGIARQTLLLPEIVELERELAAAISTHAQELAEMGLVLEAFGPGAVLVREVPALLDGLDVKALVRDLADELGEWGESRLVAERIERFCATLACHTSVRAGTRLSQAEMDALLRQMEGTPNSGQCNHGRPTFVALDLAQIERLFGRR